jgi:hypothetical protein
VKKLPEASLPPGFEKLRPADLNLLSSLGGFNEWLRAVLCTLARRGVAFRQDDPERASQLLQVLSPFPYYKAGQFLFDLLEWEDFMLDGPEPPIVPTALDAASLGRLAQWLDELRSAIDSSLDFQAMPRWQVEPGQTPIPEKLPPLEPGFYLYQDVVLGVVDSALALMAAGEAGETKSSGDSG